MSYAITTTSSTIDSLKHPNLCFKREKRSTSTPSLLLGVLKGQDAKEQLVLVDSNICTLWNRIRSFFGYGPLHNVAVKIVNVSKYLERNWSLLAASVSDSELQSKIKRIAKRAVVKGDNGLNTLFSSMNLPGAVKQDNKPIPEKEPEEAICSPLPQIEQVMPSAEIELADNDRHVQSLVEKFPQLKEHEEFILGHLNATEWQYREAIVKDILESKVDLDYIILHRLFIRFLPFHQALDKYGQQIYNEISEFLQLITSSNKFDLIGGAGYRQEYNQQRFNRLCSLIDKFLGLNEHKRNVILKVLPPLNKHVKYDCTIDKFLSLLLKANDWFFENHESVMHTFELLLNICIRFSSSDIRPFFEAIENFSENVCTALAELVEINNANAEVDVYFFKIHLFKVILKLLLKIPKDSIEDIIECLKAVFTQPKIRFFFRVTENLASKSSQKIKIQTKIITFFKELLTSKRSNEELVYQNSIICSDAILGCFDDATDNALYLLTQLEPLKSKISVFDLYPLFLSLKSESKECLKKIFDTITIEQWENLLSLENGNQGGLSEHGTYRIQTFYSIDKKWCYFLSKVVPFTALHKLPPEKKNPLYATLKKHYDDPMNIEKDPYDILGINLEDIPECPSHA